MKNLLQSLRYLSARSKISEIPSLRSFMRPSANLSQQQDQSKFTFHIETYGCQMNVNDSEIVRSILTQRYTEVDDPKKASILLLNTCAIREAAEEKIIQRIKNTSKNVVIGILGCMAERLKEKMFSAGVKVVCGPDAYRDLPRLLSLALEENENQMNVMLSAEETYADIAPIRKDPNSVSAFLSIMRGCNNMCSYCIVPFVRGRQRSRNLNTILDEIGTLQKEGVKEVTFLGQNVNSYHDTSTQIDSPHSNAPGFSEMFKLRQQPGARFADLLEAAAERYPNIRFRFTSPHPKDFPDKVIEVIKKYNNICNHVHLPVQSGNNEVLMRMRRNYTVEAYLQLVAKMKSIDGLALSTDLIAGFCGETEQQFQETLQLMRKVKFELAFMFAYSMRERTHAHRNYEDDVPQEVKQRRLKQMIDLFVELQAPLNQKEIGQVHLILLEEKSKRDEHVLQGKTDNFKKSYAKITSVPVYKDGMIVQNRPFKVGDFLVARVDSVGPRALYCKPIAIASTLSEFYKYQSLFLNENYQSEPKQEYQQVNPQTA